MRYSEQPWPSHVCRILQACWVRLCYTRAVPRAAAIAVLILAGAHISCGSKSPTGPASRGPVGGGPAPAPAAPSITAVSPALGSTGGGTVVKISGTGFSPGSTVTLDGELRLAFFENFTTLRFTTQAHAAGSADVVVTNDGGQSRLTAGYAYASPASFNFNGGWIGYAVAHPEVDLPLGPHHSDMEVQFTVRGNALSGFSCGGLETVFSPARTVTNGEFSFVGSDGAKISGKIVSAGGAVGVIDTGYCPDTRWSAQRQ